MPTIEKFIISGSKFQLGLDNKGDLWWREGVFDEVQRLKRAKLRALEYARKYRLLRRYGLTVKEYDALDAKQEHKCLICKESPKTTKDWHLDHDHETGKIRGFLCSRCNQGLGYFRDNPELLITAANYIKANVVSS